MLGSKNHFFKQRLTIRAEKRRDVNSLLKIKGYNDDQIEVYLKAYDYFCDNPHKYDGATIVKDLCDIPGLDLDAMLHDYHYVVYNIAANFYTKWKADWLFSKGQERKGKGIHSPYTRLIGLTIISIGFVPYTNWKRGKTTAIQENSFFSDYNTLIK